MPPITRKIIEQTILEKPTVRESNFELLRLFSQFCIVLYHIFLLFIYPGSNYNPIYKSIQIPLHVGVIIFVLLSGYFTIKPSSKRLIKVLSIFFVYSLSEVVYNLLHADNKHEIVSSLLFFSHTHFWFIRTYIYLFLISPLLNKYIESTTNRQFLYLLLAFAFISIYIGTIGGDNTLSDGKNLSNFIFLYLCGNAIRRFRSKLSFSMCSLLISCVLLNAVLFFGYHLFHHNLLGKLIWNLSFPYSSPILLLNSVLILLIFSKLRLQSQLINNMAKSSLAIYLIHANRPYAIGLVGTASMWIYNHTSNCITLLLGLIILTVIVLLTCICIDKLLTPIWHLSEKLGDTVYSKFGF